MPVSFLTLDQRNRYGRYPDSVSAIELARYFYLDDDDLEWISGKRRDFTRLGYALQLTTVRFLGTFLEDPTAVPQIVVQALATQVKVTDLTCVPAYRDSEQRWRHTTEIRLRYGYREFVDKGVRFRLGRWLCAMCWTGTDRPSVLFDHATTWLIGNKVLLPGVTVLERFIAEIRTRMETRLWTRLGQSINSDQRARLEKLLTITDDGHQSWFDKLRKGPVRISAPALVKALERIETIRALGIKLPAASNIPQSRLASLARFAGTAKVSAINRLPASKRMATLVAFVHCLEATAQDDALDVLDMLLRDLFARAEQTNRKTRLRTLRDLDKAAIILAKACRILLDPVLPDDSLRGEIDAAVGRNALAQALEDVNALTRPPNDVFYVELQKKQPTVSRFFPKLLRTIPFDSNPAGKPLLDALDWLRHRPGPNPPADIINKAWQRHVKQGDGGTDAAAYTFCVLDQLQTALRRRDIFVTPSWRYSDPRGGLLTGTEWDKARPMVCRSLALTTNPEPTLSALALELDRTYRAVVARLPENPAVRFETVNGKEELILSTLDKLDEPASLKALRTTVKERMPLVDLPEIILEIAARTEFTGAFTHVAESKSRASELTTSLCAVLLAQACNTGFEPFTNQEIPSLRRDRLTWVEQNYIRDETLVDGNARLVSAQNRIALARAWGGGDVASADGIRFVVPVRTVHAAPNPKYFSMGRGVTWYNLLSDQRTGLNALTVPGTLRDSLILLAVVLEQQTELQPTQIMTDTGAYSDVVFGLFRLLGYRFCPRLADIGGTRFWRIDSQADYGLLNGIANHKAKLSIIEPHWDDVLRLIGSLKLGRVPATGIMRTLQVGDRATPLALAIAEIGRIDKTIHILNFIDDESRRRSTLAQLNLGEGRHALARNIFHGKRGELYQRYREGQEDQLSALGLVVNVVVLWNTIYMDAVLSQLRKEGYPVLDEDVARLSPFGHEHINLLGRYSFAVDDFVARGELRPLRGISENP
jgi:TnpA family transposase